MGNRDYYELVQRAKKELSNRPDAVLKDGGHIVYRKGHKSTDLWYEGNEINLYAYWQGHQIKDKGDGIDILLVAQDWGNPDNDSESPDRIRAVIAGRSKIGYSDDDKFNPTNDRLIRMFDELGCNIRVENPGKRIFFTNYCLGYRTGSEQGNMTKTIMKKDKELFNGLVKALKPKIIICLGKITYECVIGKTVKNWVKELKNGVPFQMNYPGNNDITVYGVAHTGARGMSNIGKEEVVKVAWRKIAKDIENC